MSALRVPASPCISCPYRAEHPSGVWSWDEYEKLRGYDGGARQEPDGSITLPSLAPFHCHQENATGIETVCKGWVNVHADSVAVRLGVIEGLIPIDAPYSPPGADLFASGAEAADHGQTDVENPGPEARAMVEKLMQSKAGRLS